MTRGAVAELLADLIGGDEVLAAGTPASAANPAKSEQPCGLASGLPSCEGLLIAANPMPAAVRVAADSQALAGIRKLPNRSQSVHPCGFSQDSQGSQGDGLACAAPTDDTAPLYVRRRDKLLRWGWPAAEATAMAERLAQRDAQADPRVVCVECSHHRPGACGNHKRAGLMTREVGRELAALPQRCPGFQLVR